MPRLLVMTALFLVLSLPSAAQEPLERNVVYGTYYGSALLLDVHHPQKPNGFGLILVPGSAWGVPRGDWRLPVTYAAGLIKDGGSSLFVFVPRLLQAGYTLFVVSHRAAPRFQYPAAVDDVRRAVRFVRFHAADYGISADWIGAVGYSSGAHLVALLGVIDDAAESKDTDPVERVSSRVQSVVAGATATDLEHYGGSGGIRAMVSFMGGPFSLTDPELAKAYRTASPVTHLSKSSAPLLLIHGDADETVPFQQAELMVAAAQRVDARVRLVRVPGGTHTFPQDLAKHPEWPDVLGDTVQWLDQHLKLAAATKRSQAR